MNTDNKYIYIYTTSIVIIGFLVTYFLMRKLFSPNHKVISQNALNYKSSTQASIAAVDPDGNISVIPQSIIPGMIIIWFPTDSTFNSLALVGSSGVPKGWAICDGTQGTPDLRGRFVLMAQDSAYSIMSTGGAATHTLTEAEMPSHNHDFFADFDGNGMPNSVPARYGNQNRGTRGTHHRGGNQPHNNMPPYYTLVYIMKL
jgi:microcystin-dependent protein